MNNDVNRRVFPNFRAWKFPTLEKCSICGNRSFNMFEIDDNKFICSECFKDQYNPLVIFYNYNPE